MNNDKTNIKQKNYFRSLDELSQTEEFKQFVQREFPEGASEMNNAWSRRNFLTLMGASMALAGLAGCRRPKEHIVPYVKPPEEIIPGIPQHYATSMPVGTSNYGIVVESHEGRPTKVEGNEKHPSSLGSSNSWMQAAILGLYDPDRSATVRQGGAEKTYEDFKTAYTEIHKAHTESKGDGLAILSEEYASPTLQRLRAKFKKQFPNARWVTYSPVSEVNKVNGTFLATGQSLRPVYNYAKADVILSLDSDFIVRDPEAVTAAKEFAGGRTLADEHTAMNRLYAVESNFTSTGATADHRLVLRPYEIKNFIVALADALDISSASAANVNLTGRAASWLEPLAADLKQSGSKAVVVAGAHLPAAVHALVAAINNKLSSDAVTYISTDNVGYSDIRGMAALAAEMKAGNVTTLVMLGGDPIYNAPADLGFASALKQVKNSIHLSLYNDETSRNSSWHLPMAHFFEAWSDAVAADGTSSVVQPLIAPLLDGIMPLAFLNFVISGEDVTAYDLVRESWQVKLSGTFEKGWRKVLHDGVLTDSRAKKKNVSVKTRDLLDVANSLVSEQSDTLSLIFTTSPSVYDGSFANNGWLQELPDAATRLAWDNVAQMSPKTAEKYGYKNEDVIKISNNGTEIEAPVWLVPGQADDTVIVELGYGRKKLGRVAEGAGFSAYPLRMTSAMYYTDKVTLNGTGRAYSLATVQDHWSMENRPLVLEATKEEYEHHPEFTKHAVHHQPLKSMWEEHKYDEGYQWGMAIDLTACTGCNACTIACQSENNIPIIGKEEVKNGREMHWIRIDRYFHAENDDYSDSDKIEMVHQPVGCQHCELAPCEQVCPVAATTHDKEGLNTMVYNRCIGTRYCSNNCPYKVRRFNFFNFTKETPEIVKMAMNPDVTVRSRGVMEKCTYCTQRINRAKIDAKKDDRKIIDGEVVAACQQACPSNAITFGDINDPESKVTKVKERNRDYHLLVELNVRPRTSYQAKIRNKNPKMPTA